MESVVMQLEQNMGGMYGDYMAIALATAGAAAAVLRPFPKFGSLLTSVAFMLNADIILFLAVALWAQGGHDIYHNHLILLLFLASIILRFSATWPDDGTASAGNFQAVVNRSLRRVSEYTIIIFPARALVRGAYAGNAAASGIFIASLAVFVASSRSYESFRPWRLHQSSVQIKSESEEAQIRQLVVYFRQALGASPENVPPNLLPGQRQRATRCGNYETQRHAFDLAFLWLNGSAPIIISAIVLVSTVISTMNPASRYGFLAVWIKVLYILAQIYLCCHSIPGLAAFVVTESRTAVRSCRCRRPDVHPVGQCIHTTLAACLFYIHANYVKLWVSDMWEFCRSSAAASPDLPTRCRSVPAWLSRLIAYVEGAELLIHIAVAFISRLLVDGIFILVLHLAYIFLGFLRCSVVSRLIRRRKSAGPTASAGDGSGQSNDSVSASVQGKAVLTTDVAAVAAFMRLSLCKLTYLICRPELRNFDEMYPPGQPSYVILGVQFIQMNTRSQYNMRSPIDFPLQRDIESHDYDLRKLIVGYCWLEKGAKLTDNDDPKGYAYLKAKCLKLPWEMECERAGKYGVRGGWITMDDKPEKLYMWGDTDPCVDDNDIIDEVGHFYAGVPYGNYLRKDASHPNYKKPSEIRVWLKFGYNPIRISHIWRDGKSVLPKCSCYPSASDPHVKCLAFDVSSYPELSTFQIALVP